MEKDISIIRKNLDNGKVIFGESETLKAVKKGSAAIVFLASNAKEELKKSLERYKKTGKFELKQLDIDNNELGAFCKKQFNIAVLTLLK